MVNVDLDSKEYGCEFHHVHLYVDELQPLETYKLMEDNLNKLAEKGSYDPFSGGMVFLDPHHELPSRVLEGQEVWKKLCEQTKNDKCAFLNPDDFTSGGQDVVEQVIIGLGWRVTAEYKGANTRSLLVTSQDPLGVKLVVSTKLSAEQVTNSEDGEPYAHFDAANIDRFYTSTKGHQGIAVLGFELPEEGAIEATYKRYQEKHPKLLLALKKYTDTRTVYDSLGKAKKIVLGSISILEAFAYYKTDVESGIADEGVVLRFVYREGDFSSKPGFGNPQGVLPGLADASMPAVFDGTSIPAYSDHWVSNVTDRHSFLSTLEDVLGFTPKVDFNAGVVAAGQAKIESTVTGNNTARIKSTCDSDVILKDQSQVYLPINNTLTSVGHVHGFLDQIGQGVQHLASRVKNLVLFIERVNNYRKITGRGFTFLNIPQSYYGRLDVTRDLLPVVGSEEKAIEVMANICQNNLCSLTGIVTLDIEDSPLSNSLSEISWMTDELKTALSAVIKKARYSNLYSLLQDHFQENTYLQIVRNKILVDIQANDVLFQIFTCNVLQRNDGEESPFLEFIQRVCSEKTLPDGTCAPIKPGCGGFGIRNFLTLFLSIEVSKAMGDEEKALLAGDKVAADKAKARVDLFTKQLDESNPVLTSISDAMTAEGNALEILSDLRAKGSSDSERIKALETTIETQSKLKLEGNEKLQELSKRYSDLMEQYK